MDGKTGALESDPDDEFGGYAIAGLSKTLFQKTSLFANAKYTVLVTTQVAPPWCYHYH